VRTLPLPEAIAIIQAGQQRCWYHRLAGKESVTLVIACLVQRHAGVDTQH
jgi:hypothetical protein